MFFTEKQLKKIDEACKKKKNRIAKQSINFIKPIAKELSKSYDLMIIDSLKNK